MFNFIKQLYNKAVKLVVSIYDAAKVLLQESVVQSTEVTVVYDPNAIEEEVFHNTTSTIESPEERADRIANQVVTIVGKVALFILSTIIVANFFYLILLGAMIYYTYKTLNFCISKVSTTIL